MHKEKIYDILIIGAGASGLMAAIAAKTKSDSCDLVLLEKNPLPAKKIYATGNGRCNFLNKNATPANYFNIHFSEYNFKVINSVFAAMPSTRVLDEFKRIGIIAIEEEDGRLYPRSLQAKNVAEALCMELKVRKVPIICGDAVKSCFKENGYYNTICVSGKQYYSHKVIITTGGKAGCQYGSEGDGYKLAKNFGHQIVKPIPALTQLLTENSSEELFGVRAKASISLWKENKGVKCFLAKDSGEIQFTKEGLSGICTFNISRYIQFEEDTSYEVDIDLFEEYTECELEELFVCRAKQLIERDGRAILYGLLPDKLVDAVLARTNINGDCKVENINKKSLEKLVEVSKAFSFNVIGTKSWKDAQVTAGGVVLCEIEPKTLESKIEEGLFFAGEILDVDGLCGGYNLGWAFASGYVAGMSAAQKQI